MTCINCNILSRKIRLLTEENVRLKNKVLELDQGWKGIDHIGIEQNDDIWIITEHRKSKTTYEVAEMTHRIDHNNVVFMANLLRRLTRFGKAKYVEVIREIIRMRQLPCSRNSFNGGENRTNYYFPLYYWPVKILEHLGYIEYDGRGNITMIKNFGVEITTRIEKKPEGLDKYV